MRHLPVLPARDAVDEIEIASPCTVPWDSMRGDQLVRFCGQCQQNVYNIQSFTRPEARRLIEAREARRCVRLLRRDDGTVVTADCWTRLRAARRRGWLAVAAVLVMIGWTQLSAMRFGWGTLSRWWKTELAPCPIELTIDEEDDRPAPAAAPIRQGQMTMGEPPRTDDKPRKLIRMAKRKAPNQIMGGMVQR